MLVLCVLPPPLVCKKKTDLDLHNDLLARLDGRKEGKLRKTKARYLSRPQKKDGEKQTTFPVQGRVCWPDDIALDDPRWDTSHCLRVVVEIMVNGTFLRRGKATTKREERASRFLLKILAPPKNHAAILKAIVSAGSSVFLTGSFSARLFFAELDLDDAIEHLVVKSGDTRSSCRFFDIP